MEQLTRYLELLNRDPLLAPVQGVFAAQEIRPINADDMDHSRGLIDAVDHPVGTTERGVKTAELPDEGLADPVRVVQEGAGQELGDR